MRTLCASVTTPEKITSGAHIAGKARRFCNWLRVLKFDLKGIRHSRHDYVEADFFKASFLEVPCIIRSHLYFALPLC